MDINININIDIKVREVDKASLTTKKTKGKCKVSNVHKVYELVTEKIIEKLEQGVVPWRKPFQSSAAVNWKTQKAYRGINTWILDDGEYATFKQIKEAGGKIKKGAKSQIVVYWHWYKFKEEGQENVPDNEANFIKGAKPFYYRVFEINTQVEGLKSKRELKSYDHDPIEEAEKVVDGYMGGPDYSFKSVGAWYRPFEDLVNVPPIKEFRNVAEYYSTLFHEMIHSTGHKSRLNR